MVSLSTHVRVIGALLASLCLAFASPAVALDDGDRAAMRSAVDGQIAAFRADDAEGAYAFAAPSIQQMFGNPAAFMQMVRSAYPPVYRPRRYDFAQARDVPSGVEQAVKIDDADGVGWDAIYSFERQSDGAWKISGCRLVRAPDQAV